MTKYFFMNVLLFAVLGFVLSSNGLPYNTLGYWLVLALTTIIYVVGCMRGSELQTSSDTHRDRDRPL